MKNQQAQEDQYEFPYHWLPSFSADGRLISFGKNLEWALEYQSYISTICDFAKTISPKRILDVGCGDGRVTDMVFRSVENIDLCLGVDYSERAIAFAKMFADRRITFSCRRLDEIEDNFDLVSLIEVYEHIPPSESASFIKTVGSKVKSGGYLIVSVPSTNIPVNEKHYRHFSKDVLINEVATSSGLEMHKLYFCHSKSRFSNLLRKILINRLWTLNESHLQKFLINLYSRKLKHAKETDCSHIVCVFIKP